MSSCHFGPEWARGELLVQLEADDGEAEPRVFLRLTETAGGAVSLRDAAWLGRALTTAAAFGHAPQELLEKLERILPEEPVGDLATHEAAATIAVDLESDGSS